MSEPQRIDEILIHEIIRILNLPGEDYTDGECLGQVADLLEERGYKVWSHKE